MVNILLAEDDQTLGAVIADNLQHNGYAVHLAEDGEQAIEIFATADFDICLLDVMLPKKDGFHVAKAIREKNNEVPILFLTAKSMVEDRLTGFQSGGDDYITKPFSMKELLYRIEVFLKRSGIKEDEKEVFQMGNLSFDYTNLTLKSTDNSFALTQKEADVLMHLCRHKNSVVKRSDLLKAVWGDDDYFLGRSMDVFISKLRKYLKNEPSVSITNVHGVGFKLEEI